MRTSYLKAAMVAVFLLFSGFAAAEVALSEKTGAFPENYHNEVYLRAGERGCLSCHDNLNELSQRAGPKTHAVAYLGRAYGKIEEPTYCFVCHGPLPGSGNGPQFGGALHASHTPARGFTGDCFSCHLVDNEGKFRLWDRVKYDVEITNAWPDIFTETDSLLAPINTPRAWLEHRGNFNGFRDGFSIDSELKGTMQANQGGLTAKDDVYVAINYGLPETFLPADKDYKVTVTGDMANKTRTYTLEELRKRKQSTIRFTKSCAVNPANGSMVYNAEYTGIPLLELLNEAGIKEGANYVRMTAYDGWQGALNLRILKKHGGIVALKMFDKNIEPMYGGPVAAAIPGEIGASSTMWLKTIEILKVDESIVPPLVLGPIKDKMEVVSSGFLTPARDGTIIGKKTAITGWTYAFSGIPVTYIELSADRGKSWKRFDMPQNADPLQWVNWKFEWEAPASGVYMLKVRAYADSSALKQLTEASVIVVVK